MTVKRLPGYVFSQDQVPGVVAANTYVALLNPVGSGKVVLVGGVFISSATVGAVSGAPPLRGFLATNLTGGVQAAMASIGRTKSTLPNPVGQIFTGNPSATLGAAWFNSPALETTGSESAPLVHQVPAAIPGGDPITLFPGEATVIRSSAGDTDQRWNISIAWTEAG